MSSLNLSKIKIFEDKPFADERGYLWSSWNKKKLNLSFNQDKFSISKKNVLRGLHGDYKTWKLLSCVSGNIFLVVVNYDPKSVEFLRWQSWNLREKDGMQILIPPNFLNGHLCLSNKCTFHYKLFYKGHYNDVEDQLSVKWNDPRINIKWPISKPILSKRDK